MIILLTTSLMVTSWHDCWFQVPVPSRVEITSYKTYQYQSWSVSASAIWLKTRTLPATCAFSRKCRVPRWVGPGKLDIEKPREP
jgi:hypothetical protein